MPGHLETTSAAPGLLWRLRVPEARGGVLGPPRLALFGDSNAASRRGRRPGPGPTPRGHAGPRRSAARQPPPASAPVPRGRVLCFPLSAKRPGTISCSHRAARPSVLHLEQDGEGAGTGGRRVPPVPTRNVGGRPRLRDPRKAPLGRVGLFLGIIEETDRGSHLSGWRKRVNLPVPGPGRWARDAHVSRENLHSSPSPTPANPPRTSPIWGGKTPDFQNKFFPALWPQAGEEQPEYTPGEFCTASSFEGRDCSSCCVFSA